MMSDGTLYTQCMTETEKTAALKQVRTASRKMDRANDRAAVYRAERDELMRTAKALGATWGELQSATGMNPTAVSQALRRGV